MKKIYLSIALCFAFSFSFGQASLTTANLGEIGDYAKLVKIDTTGFDVGASGSGVTWDFSSFSDFGADTTVWEYIATPAGVSADITITNGPNYYYYDTTASGDALHKVGENDSLFTLENNATYTDPQIYFEYPYGAGSPMITDSFAGTFDVLLGVVADRKGADTSEVDADGNITLPDGRTYENVIRIKRHVVWEDSGSGFGYTLLNNYDYTTWEWWDSNGVFPIMKVEERVFTAFTAPGYEFFAWYAAEMPMPIDTTDTTDTSTFIFPMRNANVGSLEAFPNPMSESGTISYELVKPGEIRISLYDLQGRRVEDLYQGYQTQGAHRLDFDPALHARGMYFIRLANKEGYVGRKIVIE